MRLEGTWETKYRLTDLVLLLAAVCLALSTWAWLSGSAGVPLWKPYLSVFATFFLALAALTRHPLWSASIRLLASGWIIAAPWLLGFADIASAQRTYLAIGALIAAMSIPGAAGIFTRRASLPV